MAWQPIVEFLGGATLFAGVLGYVGKAAIDAFLKEDLQSIKLRSILRAPNTHRSLSACRFGVTLSPIAQCTNAPIHKKRGLVAAVVLR